MDGAGMAGPRAPRHRKPTHLGLRLRTLACGVFLFGAHLRPARAEVPVEAFTRWAKAHAIPLRTVEPDPDSTDLLPLVSLVGSARVVALGEPTHGAHEPLAFRNRLIRFLIERMGFTAIALEAGFTESHLMARYVAGDSGELQGVVRHGMTWGFGALLENEELIQWVRAHNATTTSKVRLYGIDLTGGDAGEFLSSRHAVDFALEFLGRVDAATHHRLRRALEPLLARFSSHKYADLSPTDRERLSSRLGELTAALQRDRSSLVRVSSDEEYAWALHSVVVARQLSVVFEVAPPYAPPTAQVPPDADRQMKARDSAMADNVRWALEREGPKGRLVVFAHNMHVANSAVVGGVWSDLRTAPKMMGSSLRETLGAELVIIGTLASHAVQDIPRPDLYATSVEPALSVVGAPRFVLDLRPAQMEPSVAAWLSEPQTVHANLTTHVVVTPGTAFDALFFVDTLTEAHQR